MRKRELVGAIAQEVGLQPREVAKVVDSLLGRLADELLETRRLEITDFGIFHVQDLKERRLYVPKRKETIVIPARRAVKFREVGELRERLNPQSVAGDKS